MLLITLIQDSCISTTVLPDVPKGHYRLNHRIEYLKENISIDGINNQWWIASGSQYRIDKLEDKPRRTVCAEDTFDILTEKEKILLIAEKIADEKNRFLKFRFPDHVTETSIRIGREQDNDIVLEDNYISSNHVTLQLEQGKWYLTAHESENGTYVNNIKAEPKKKQELHIGDVVFLVGYRFIICADFIAANISSSCLKSSKIEEFILNSFSRPRNASVSVPDYFYRTVNLEQNAPDFQPIRLLPPERKADSREQPVLLSLGSALTMSTASMLVAGYSALAAYYRGTNLSYIVPSFIMAGSMILSSLIWPSFNRSYQKKWQIKQEEARCNDYHQYILDLRDKINIMKDEEKKYLRSQYYTIQECINRVISRDRCLWSRTVRDTEFMTASLGTGTRRSAVQIKFQENDDIFFKDTLRYTMMQFAHEEQLLENAPITISLNHGCICGLTGDSEQSCNFIKQLVIQLTALYSYDELKLIFIFRDEKENSLSCFRWLPHVWNNAGDFRYIASSPDEIKELGRELEKEINTRTSHPDGDFPRMLIIAADKKLAESMDILPVMIKHREKLGFSFLTAFGLYNYSSSDLIIDLAETPVLHSRTEQGETEILWGNPAPVLYNRTEHTKTTFKPYAIPSENILEYYLDKISNIRLDISSQAYQLPDMITFLEMFRVSKAEHLNSLTRWTENNPIKSLKTEIGVLPSGDLFYIDLHEKFHGPHGIIAGTTGSGKSEVIITFVLSLSVNYSPEEVAFVIIDYKGGGLADAFDITEEITVDGKTIKNHHKLPHVVGTVTNLDGDTIERARISIDTELERRQYLFKEARRLSGEGTMDIYKYQKLRREGLPLDPLPHLFIICDEFAELRRDNPEFLDLLVSTARIGRSLGVHLILATQKPDGVVGPQIMSNSRFKICLKVQDKADSTSMINCPDAAEISVTGRFFFQVGYHEVFTMGQSAWSGADYIPAEEFIKTDKEAVEIISRTGNVLYEKIRRPEAIRQSENTAVISQLVAVRNYLIDIGKNLELPSLWLEPVPAKLSLVELYREMKEQPRTGYFPLCPVIGKKDDLYNRVQEILTVSFSEKGNVLVYGSGGKSPDMFFITLIYSMIFRYRAEDVNLYILDFDAGFLKTFEKAPHVGDVVTSDAEETQDVKQLIESIRLEILNRNKLFSDYRGDYETYCRYSGKKKPPYIVLILNNYTEFTENFDTALTTSLTYIAREGAKRGVFVVIGTSSVNISFRLKQYIPQTFMLQMNNQTDYLSVFGKNPGVTPSACAGSGIVMLDHVVYKFQTADIFDPVLPDDVSADASSEIRTLCAQALKQNTGKTAVSYRSFRLSSSDILASEKITCQHVPVGTANEEIVFYDFSDKYVTFISSFSEKLLTNFAEYLTKAFLHEKAIDVIVLDASGMLRPEDEKEYPYYSNPEELKKWNDFYLKEETERCNAYKQGKNLSEIYHDLYIIINGFSELCTRDNSNIMLAYLKSIIANWTTLNTHYILLDASENLHTQFGVYINIIQDLTDEEKKDMNAINQEHHRDWFDASAIWLGEGIEKDMLFRPSGTLPQLSDAEAILIQNKAVVQKFTLFS